jgi:hypothetical protein
MAIDFPDSPTDGEVFTSGTKTWIYSLADTKWYSGGGLVGPQGPTGPNYSLGFRSATFYAPMRWNSSNVTMTEDVTYYQAFFVQETITIDRICIYTSGFSGSSVIRLGVYNTSNGSPSTVLFDAGTVTASANTTNYAITISETLNTGWYWTAVNAQTITSGTCALRGSGQYYREGLTAVDANADINNRDNLQETGITGAFTTAGTLTANNSVPFAFFRKA